MSVVLTDDDGSVYVETGSVVITADDGAVYKESVSVPPLGEPPSAFTPSKQFALRTQCYG